MARGPYVAPSCPRAYKEKGARPLKVKNEEKGPKKHIMNAFKKFCSTIKRPWELRGENLEMNIVTLYIKSIVNTFGTTFLVVYPGPS